MLKILHQIVQEVNDAPDLDSALNVIVEQVHIALESEACSVFLLDRASDEYVLMAAYGLNLTAVKQIRFERAQGLVGLIGEREEPINLDDARQHERFVAYSSVGEDAYHAFLGVPIIHQRQLLGVIIVQRAEVRRYTEAEEAFLTTISAQLAGVIAHAEALGTVSVLAESTAQEDDTCLQGLTGSSGVAIGVAVAVYPRADLKAVPEREAEDIDAEIELFERALATSRKEIKRLRERLAASLPASEQALFDAYLQMLDSSSLGDDVIAEIKQGQWAQGALRRVIRRNVKAFEAMEDSYLQERATDVRDLGRRVLSHLQAVKRTRHDYPAQTILVGEEVSAATLAEVPEGSLAAVVCATGSGNSHVAILARALGVPTVMGVGGLPVSKLDGRELIVDGYYGQVHITPSKKLRQEFLSLIAEEHELNADLEGLRGLPAETQDGQRIALYVNTGLAADTSVSLSVGAEGVGLYRTEVPFMVRDRFPSEEEQRIVYRQLLAAFAPRPVTMRTLDIGGDKVLPYFSISEENPFLGWRGIRVTLDHPEVFLVQLRAMLRANADFGNLKIMFPMISSVAELEEALRLFNKAYRELEQEIEDLPMPPIGVMVEVPAAVYQAKALAERVDFLSVGSNDLTQYLLAVDRNNSRVANLYDSLHPSILHAIYEVVQAGHSANSFVSICGEMASDPVAVVLLLGMGFDALSMSSSSLPRIKWVIRKFSQRRAKALLDEVLSMDRPAMIRFHIEQVLEQEGLGGLIRAGK